MKSPRRSFMYWPEIDEDLEEECRNCEECQLHSNKPQADKDHSRMPSEKLSERLHVDFAENFMGTKLWIRIANGWIFISNQFLQRKQQ